MLCVIQIVIIMNFVVVSSVGIKKVDCIIELKSCVFKTLCPNQGMNRWFGKIK